MAALSKDSEATTKTTDVYCWWLESKSEVRKTPLHTQSLNRIHESDGTELVVNTKDGRMPVDPKHYKKVGGKYRGML